jgi:hypothetical protein
MLVPPDNRLSQSGTLLARDALEAAGIPTLSLDADMVDAQHWDHDHAVAVVEKFLVQAGALRAASDLANSTSERRE